MYSYPELKKLTERRFSTLPRQFSDFCDISQLPEINPENTYPLLAISVLLEEHCREKCQLSLIGDNNNRARTFSRLPKMVQYQNLSHFGTAAAKLKQLNVPKNKQEFSALLNHPIILSAAAELKNKNHKENFAEILDNMMAVPLAETLAHREFPDLDLTAPIENNPLMTIAICSNRQKLRTLVQNQDFQNLLQTNNSIMANLHEICQSRHINQYISLINTLEPIASEFHQGGVCRLLEFTAHNMGYKLPIRPEISAFRPANSNLIDDFYSDEEKNKIPCCCENDPLIETALNTVAEHYPQVLDEDGAIRYICEHARPIIRGLGFHHCARKNKVTAPLKLPSLKNLNDLIRRSYPDRYPEPNSLPFSYLLRKRYSSGFNKG